MRSLLYSLALLSIAALSATYDEDLMLRLVNNEQVKVGLKALCFNPQLAAATQAHSNDLASYRRKGQHIGADGSDMNQRCAHVNYKAKCGENVAWDCRGESGYIEMWMTNNNGGREVILDTTYTEFGSAVAYDSANNPYYTQVFGKANSGGNGNN